MIEIVKFPCTHIHFCHNFFLFCVDCTARAHARGKSQFNSSSDVIDYTRECADCFTVDYKGRKRAMDSSSTFVELFKKWKFIGALCSRLLRVYIYRIVCVIDGSRVDCIAYI